MFSLKVTVIIWLRLVTVVPFAGFMFVMVGFMVSVWTWNVLFSVFCSGLPARSWMLFMGMYKV